jgi:hypothetical protein
MQRKQNYPVQRITAQTIMEEKEEKGRKKLSTEVICLLLVVTKTKKQKKFSTVQNNMKSFCLLAS